MTVPELSVLIDNIETDAQRVHEAVSKDMVVMPRDGDPYKSVPMVIREGTEKIQAVVNQGNQAIDTFEGVLLDKVQTAMIEANGFVLVKDVTTLETLVPSEGGKGAMLYNGDFYAWNANATPEPKWEFTGLNYIRDSEAYIKKNIIGGTPYTEYTTAIFVNVIDNVINLKGDWPNVKTAIMEVKPNTRYKVTGFNINAPTAFGIHESPTKSDVFNFPLSKVAPVLDSNGDGYFITKETTNYVYVNISFDTYRNEGVKIEYGGNPILFGSEVLSQDSLQTGEVMVLGENLHNKAVYIPGKVINLTSDQLISFPVFVTAQVPVVPGQKYYFYCDDYLINGFVIAFRPTDDKESGDVFGRKTVNDITVDGNGVFSFVVPDGMNYLLYNVQYDGDGRKFDIRKTTRITQDAVKRAAITHIDNTPLVDEYARQKLSEISLEVGPTTPMVSALKGKRWLAIGDSITDYSFRPYSGYKNFTQQLAEKHDMVVYNYGQSGTGFYGRYDVASTITQTEDQIDFITLFWGTNDWGNIQAGRPNNKPLGVFGDTDTQTISGCMKQVFSELALKFPATPIYIITPLPRSDAWGNNPPQNSQAQQGYRLSELVNLLKMYASEYSMNVLDFYTQSNFRVQTEAMKQMWTVGGDGVHPNDQAHARLVPLVESFLIGCGR